MAVSFLTAIRGTIPHGFHKERPDEMFRNNSNSRRLWVAGSQTNEVIYISQMERERTGMAENIMRFRNNSVVGLSLVLEKFFGDPRLLSSCYY